MDRYVVDLHIPATQLLRYYRGTFSLSVDAGNRLRRIERLG
jgi:hypothetical protein